MTAQTISNNKRPVAYITNRNDERFKSYEEDGKSVIYLDDGMEFQVELDNPTADTYCCTLVINGKESEQGIVVRPGEHIFLDRYLDESRKFEFDTYFVPEKNKDATKKNGTLKVLWYKERSRRWHQDFIWVDSPSTWKPDTGTPHWGQQRVTCDSHPNFRLDDSSGNINFNSLSTSDDLTLKADSLKIGNVKIEVEDDEDDEDDGNENVETGRIEKGSDSDQEFHRYHGNFESIPTYKSKFKLLPRSRKPRTKKVRRYCTQCGYRVRKRSWEFCPQCGSEIE